VQENVNLQQHDGHSLLAILKLSNRDFACLCLLFLFVIICWFSYLKLPLEEDQKIFLAAARIADQKTEAFPFNVYSSWELKPIGNRIVVYLFYKAANLIADYSNKEEFEFILKIIYSTVIILAAFIFTRSLKSAFPNCENMVFLFLWPITIIAFFTLNSENAFQTDEFAVILQILTLPLMLSRRKLLNLLAGFPLAFLLTIKGITILASVQLFVFVYFLGKNYRRNFMLSLAGFSFFLVCVILSVFGCFPNEVVELRNATLYQNSFSGAKYLGLNRIFHFFYYIPFIINSIPVMFTGILGFFLVFSEQLKKQRKESILFLCMWSISFLYVVIQGKFFSYHYLTFLFPIFITIAILLDSGINTASLRERHRILRAFWSLLVLAVTFYIAAKSTKYIFNNEASLGVSIVSLVSVVSLCVVIIRPKDFSCKRLVFFMAAYALIAWFLYGSLWGRFSRREMKAAEKEQRIYTELKLKYQLHKEPNILYLSDGVFTYYMDAPSFSRYFLPVCLARAKSDQSLKSESVFKETMEEALSYDGEYIVYQPEWIRLEVLPALRDKIEKEYKLTYENREIRRKICVYKRRL